MWPRAHTLKENGFIALTIIEALFISLLFASAPLWRGEAGAGQRRTLEGAGNNYCEYVMTALHRAAFT